MDLYIQFYRKIINHSIIVVLPSIVIRFVSYVKPCATCIHYANDEPQGIEVTMMYACVVPLDSCNACIYILHVVSRNNDSIADCILCSTVTVQWNCFGVLCCQRYLRSYSSYIEEGNIPAAAIAYKLVVSELIMCFLLATTKAGKH